MFVIHRAASVDAKAPRLSDRVNIGAQEDEFPIILLFLLFDHAADLIVRVVPAGILHTVRRDDENGLLRHILLTRVLVDRLNVLNRSAHCIQKRCAAAHVILSVRHRLNLADINTVIGHFGSVVKEYDRNIRFTVFPLLLLDHAVEAADRIFFQAPHGAASVKDHYEFCQTFFHFCVLLSTRFVTRFVFFVVLRITKD